MNVGSVVHKAIAKAEADAVAVKNAILKAVSELDNVILPEASVLEPAVAQVAGTITPGGAAIVNVAYAWLEACAKVLDSAGAAAEGNFASAGLDSALVTQVKALVPTLKAAAKS